MTFSIIFQLFFTLGFLMHTGVHLASHQPSTHSGLCCLPAQTSLSQLPPVDVYLFRKFVDAALKDLAERLKPGYGRKPRAMPPRKLGGWKRAPASKATPSAKVWHPRVHLLRALCMSSLLVTRSNSFSSRLLFYSEYSCALRVLFTCCIKSSLQRGTLATP